MGAEPRSNLSLRDFFHDKSRLELLTRPEVEGMAAKILANEEMCVLNGIDPEDPGGEGELQACFLAYGVVYDGLVLRSEAERIKKYQELLSALPESERDYGLGAVVYEGGSVVCRRTFR